MSMISSARRVRRTSAPVTLAPVRSGLSAACSPRRSRSPERASDQSRRWARAACSRGPSRRVPRGHTGRRSPPWPKNGGRAVAGWSRCFRRGLQLARASPLRPSAQGLPDLTPTRQTAELTATQRSSRACAPPESRASTARAIPAASRSSGVAGLGGVHRQRRAGVEHHGVAHRAGLAGHQAAYDLGVVGGVAAAQTLGRAAAEAEPVGVHGELPDLPAVDRPDLGGRGGGQLVEPVVAAEHPRVDAAAREHAGHQRRHPVVGAADRLRLGLGRVGERAEQVERGGDAQLAPGDRRVPHRGVERGGEAEGDAGLLAHPGDRARRAGRAGCRAPPARRRSRPWRTPSGCRA